MNEATSRAASRRWITNETAYGTETRLALRIATAAFTLLCNTPLLGTLAVNLDQPLLQQPGSEIVRAGAIRLYYAAISSLTTAYS